MQKISEPTDCLFILSGEFPDNRGYHTPYGKESQQQDDEWRKYPETGPLQVETGIAPLLGKGIQINRLQWGTGHMLPCKNGF
ncbi:MAG: hypothetical protein GY737_26140 [Desulfobacteraceae bacterium]|nr:hypothetical protein [Desulfobacteraceae bacterium]